jgi:hypothetical protein
MLERGLDLLRDGGSLSFIIPATLLADSTAEKLRRKILDDSNVLALVEAPEKARVFSGVTQACLILVTRKGQPTQRVHPVMWDGRGPIPSRAGVEITRNLIEKCGSRIPLVRSREEKELLEALMRHPMLRGDGNVSAVGHVHQGEINLTVHRRFITDTRTANVYPLIRGEHVEPFQVVHPSPRGARLDWVLPDFFTSSRDRSQAAMRLKNSSALGRTRGMARGAPWENERIVLGRVVNMGTERRLKAAAAPRGVLLGDMTNFITDITAPLNYLLGVLNSSLLNWRISVTSTNNYISAHEIGSLPVPRVSESEIAPETVQRAWKDFASVREKAHRSVGEWVEKIGSAFGSCSDKEREALAATMIERVVGMIRAGICTRRGRAEPGMQNLLDALVLILYEVGWCARLLERV